jgi:hypothetical protein
MHGCAVIANDNPSMVDQRHEGLQICSANQIHSSSACLFVNSLCYGSIIWPTANEDSSIVLL